MSRISTLIELPTLKPASNISCLPKSIYFFVVAELLERINNYGTLALLNQYLKSGFGLPTHVAKGYYHLINFVIYISPLIGGGLSDSYFGKYYTILIFYTIYITGSVLLSVFSMNFVVGVFGSYPLWSFFVPFILIAFGSGGIQPCLLALGADQFRPDQSKLLDKFFFLFTLLIFAGYFVSTLTIPYFKEYVRCGGIPCYFLAFGITSFFNILSLLVLITGSRYYKIKSTQKEFIPGIAIEATCYGIKKWLRATSQERKLFNHWLEFSNEKYGEKFIKELKELGQVIIINIPIIFAWMLEAQCVTQWQNQYEKMNKNYFGLFYLPTEASGNLYPLISISWMFIFSNLFSVLRKRGIQFSIMTKINAAYLLILVAFLISIFLEYQTDNYTSSLVTENGVAVSCENCLNGIWQLPQWIILALGTSLLTTNCSMLSYVEVSDNMKAFSAGIYYLAFAFGNGMILIIELIFASLSTITKLWIYWSLAVSFFFVLLNLSLFWFQPKFHLPKLDSNSGNP